MSLLCFTPDGNFILGAAPECANMFVGTGFNAFGIASGGGAGWALAEWVMIGEAPLDLWSVDIRRFAELHRDHKWVADRTLLAQKPPSHLPTCVHVQDGVALRISQPQPDTTVFVIPGLEPGQQEIPLEAEGSGRAGEIYWFVDGKLLARAPPDERVWLPPEVGTHEIRVVDAAGRGDRVEIEIRTF